MKVFVAADHAGYELKARLIPYIEGLGHIVEDCGAFTYDPADDYPDFMTACARNVASNPGSMGIIGGGSGNGEAMAANRIPGARAAVFHGRVKATEGIDAKGTSGNDDGFDIVRLAREHNDANILSFGFRFLTETELQTAIKLFFETPFSGDPRHVRRLGKF